MIRVTRINHVPMVLNSDLIEHIEITPDTVISLTSGQKFVVLESIQEVIERVIAFRAAIAAASGDYRSAAVEREPPPGVAAGPENVRAEDAATENAGNSHAKEGVWTEHGKKESAWTENARKESARTEND